MAALVIQMNLLASSLSEELQSRLYVGRISGVDKVSESCPYGGHEHALPRVALPDESVHELQVDIAGDGGPDGERHKPPKVHDFEIIVVGAPGGLLGQCEDVLNEGASGVDVFLHARRHGSPDVDNKFFFGQKTGAGLPGCEVENAVGEFDFPAGGKVLCLEEGLVLRNEEHSPLCDPRHVYQLAHVDHGVGVVTWVEAYENLMLDAPPGDGVLEDLCGFHGFAPKPGSRFEREAHVLASHNTANDGLQNISGNDMIRVEFRKLDDGVQGLLLPYDAVICFPERPLAHRLRIHERVRTRNHETVIDEHENEKRNRFDVGFWRPSEYRSRCFPR